MSAWAEVDLKVLTDIHLDPKNVRLEIASTAIEADILEDLFANENALSLVEGISKVGWLTHEVPIVLKRRGKYVVVEGNRRVAALKAIQNPMLVSDFQSRITAFTKLIPNLSALESIRVKVAPNQAQADQLIATLHTTNARKPWSPARQAAFFQAQIDSGRKYKDLLRRYPMIDVRKYVFRSHIINLIKGATYTDPKLQDYFNTTRWKRSVSALARVYESQEFLDMTGLAMDQNGAVTKAISDSTWDQLANVIVEGLEDGSIDTRSLNAVGAPRAVQLMKELRDICATDSGSPIQAATATSGATAGPSQGPTPAGGSGGAGGGTGPGSKGNKSPTPGSGAAGLTKPPKKAKKRYIDLSQHSVPLSYPAAVQELMGELSKLDIQTFPNTAFLIFRAALEKSIKAFADAKSEVIKNKKNTNGYVQLGDALAWLHDYAKSTNDKKLLQPITKVMGGKVVNFGSSANAMNAINHNHLFLVEPDEAFHMWNSIDPLLRYVLKP
jgi:hypothetical protein